MAFKDLMGKAQELTGAATDTAGKFLDEFNEALPTMRALGFTIQDFRMNMALVPEIGAKLVASVDTIDVGKINELIAKHQERKFLVTVLKGLQAAYHAKELLGSTTFNSVDVDLALGLSPHISVGFGGSASTPALAAAHT